MNNSKQPKKKLLISLIAVAGVIVILGAITAHDSRNRSYQRAATANTVNLDSVKHVNASELSRQTGKQSCYRTAWYKSRSCDTYELRVYRTTLNADQFTSDMQQQLLIHGWESDTDVPSTAFFSQFVQKGKTNVQAEVRRLGQASHGMAPLQSNVTILLSYSARQQTKDGIDINYTNGLKNKIDAALNSGDSILLVSSRTTYTTPL